MTINPIKIKQGRKIKTGYQAIQSKNGNNYVCVAENRIEAINGVLEQIKKLI